MEINYWWVGLSCTVMFMLSRRTQVAAVEPTTNKEHSFDLGPLRCYARPRISDICPEISAHIPFTIASEMERRENRIDNTLASYPSFVDANCTETVRKTLCEQNFPTCVINPDGSHEVLLPAQNACKQKLEDACPWFSDVDIDAACSLYEPTSTNYSVGNCSAHNITLNHCTVDWYVPEWILQYVKQIDKELDIARKFSLKNLNKNCWEKLKAVRCKSVGRCWALGDRLEHIISTETCNEALSCLNDDSQRVYGLILMCNLLPSEYSRLVTTPTDITLTAATTQPSGTTEHIVTTERTTVSNTTPTLQVICDSSSTSVLSASIKLISMTLAISLYTS